MPSRWEQAIRDWTIRRKILTGFGCVLALTAILGWQAIRALDRLNLANGEDAAAQFAEGLASRIRNGEFSLHIPKQ